MLTTVQRRRRANLLKTGLVVTLLVVALTPKLDDVVFPEIGFPLISTAVAAEQP